MKSPEAEEFDVDFANLFTLTGRTGSGIYMVSFAGAEGAGQGAVLLESTSVRLCGN